MSQNLRVRINQQIRAGELRVIDANGENLGVLSLEEALERARTQELDLIEISPTAKPPVAKIMDHGKYQYDEKKKAQKAKAHSHTVETKSIQIKMGTGDNDLKLKASKVSQWLNKGNRVKVEIFLRGREKYMNQEFIRTRLQRILDLIEVEYKVADGPKRGPKGLFVIVEKQK